MSEPSHNGVGAVQSYPLAITEGCRRIAPVWPLDSSIAVNPWWPLRNRPFAEVSALLGTLGQVNSLMSAGDYKQYWLNPIQAEHLTAAAREHGLTETSDQLLAWLDHDQAPLPHWHHLSELLDGLPERQRKMRWHEEINQQISQFCDL